MSASPLDPWLPEFDFGHRHAVDVPAPPGRVLAVAETYSLGASPLTRLLFRLRGLRPPGPFIPSLESIGFEVLAGTPGRETVVGLAAQLLARGRFACPLPPRGGAAFRELDLPRTLKIAASLRALPREGGAVLETETRVFCTDRAAWWLFAPYWALIRLPGGFIRRSMLAGIRKEAMGGP